MHIKFLARGTGSARAAADYLLGARDATGQLREGVEILQGDPHQVGRSGRRAGIRAQVHVGCDCLGTGRHSDRRADRRRTRFEFERTAWAGLEPDRYAWAAVVHRERDGGVHVHVLAARCDLETGRSLNIAPPGWQKTFDPLRDAFNAEQGWSRPDDPARAQGAATRAPCLRRGGAPACRPRTRARPPRSDPRLPAPACRARHGTESGRCRRSLAGGGPGGAAPGQGLPHGAGSHDRGPVAAERRAVRI